MGFADKIKNTVENLTGKAKETAGDVTGDKSLETEGQTDQAKASLKDAGESVKDAANDAKRSATD